MTIDTIRNAIETRKTRSAWDKGVNLYALDLLADLADGEGLRGLPAADTVGACAALSDRMLGGARDWDEYSYGGCALIYDGDIAARLCSPSEFRRNRGGQWNPNRRENWLDVQTRALHQAALLIWRAYRGDAL